MKQNTQKLLTWLYTQPGEAPTTTNYKELELLFPQMTPGGRRSLIGFLGKKHLIRIERIDDRAQISLSSHGQEALTALFPVFSLPLQSWQGQWSVLFFLSAPQSDRHFRYLRSLLLEHRSVDIRRGVYLFPGEFPSQVIDTCKDLYVGSILITKIQGWVFGDERSLVNKYYLLQDLIEIYSGISKEITQLLEVKNNQKGLSHKSRVQIFSVFDRLFAVLGKDPGFTHYYYPQSARGLSLLAELQSCLRL